ncbi:hypothetical protein ASPZODRAFT_1854276 [Penicilliopsis zonata CBS 506.65]|uniref:Integral membrane protein n=1 Tax=Penicilliopsis zonata CBS 506.65 TaxID=1073090 RepID=A0A1L9SI87_9EURO|nr:hypothetical protein ASPZODRAFT_1854276 [Penicilliopsis zonata CBS 506.65]OJJ46925.1 hypothetical protein ASPZODRAFT_1854276 [Penicilliopsis zonata CBS 506.65]
MGKIGRVACIFTPYLLTIASLICLLLVGLGCTKKSDNNLNNLYFFRANLQNFTTSSSTTSEISQLLSEAGVSTTNLTALLEEAEEDTDLKDFYSIGLWGYCDGSISNGTYNTTACTSPKAEFYFNPITVWGLNSSSSTEDVLPSSLTKAIKVYRDVSKWMFVAYIIAFCATLAEIVLGVFAICSRWGSCVVTLVSSVSLLFTTAASVTATALFATLTGTFNSALKDYGITGSMGKHIYIATWLAVAFSLAASLFWSFSTCCCSGRSPYSHRDGRNTRGGITAEKAPYTYEPIDHQAHPAAVNPNTAYPPAATTSYGRSAPVNNTRSNAYEPFRHVEA